MKITRITAYKVELPRDRPYRLSGWRMVPVFDTTLVKIETDAGIIGLGEVCPLGASYLPAYAAGARTGMAELAPRLIGADPTQLDAINALMDATLKGHPYAKSAFDIACWDILGQVAGLPLYALLGGRFGEDVELYQSVPHDTPEAMAQTLAEAQAEGFRRFQPKVGGEPDIDIKRIHGMARLLRPGDVAAVDANGSWLVHEAARVANAIADLDIYVEQPCASYEDCLSIRRRTRQPLVLDEVIDSLPMLLRAHDDGAMDVVNLKIAKLGGLTRTRQMRDLCVSLGIAVTLEDTGGGDVIGSAIAHLGLSTPQRFRFGTAASYYKVRLRTAEGAPVIANGCVRPSDAPGLGLKPLIQAWGEPILDVRA